MDDYKLISLQRERSRIEAEINLHTRERDTSLRLFAQERREELDDILAAGLDADEELKTIAEVVLEQYNLHIEYLRERWGKIDKEIEELLGENKTGNDVKEKEPAKSE